MQAIASFEAPCLAHLAKGKLESEGITAVLADEHTMQLNSSLSYAIGGIRLMVPDGDADRARMILATETDASGTANRCPECGASPVSLNRYTIWSLIPKILLILPLFLLKKWRCDECEKTW